MGNIKMKIIMLCGKKKSGKTTSASFLRSIGVKNHGFQSDVYSFAGPLKRMVKEGFSLSDSQVWGSDREKVDERYGVTPRKLLQIFGTDIFFKYIYDLIPDLENKIPKRKFWTRLFVEYTKHTTNELIIIDDGRFPHEAEEIRKLGGVVVRLYRKETDKHAGDHPSETEVDEIKADYEIHNDGSILSLFDNLRRILMKVVGKEFGH